MGALHKNTTLLCGERQARHTLFTFHIADPQSLLLSVCAITLIGVVAFWQDNRSWCKFVNAMPYHIPYPHSPVKATPPKDDVML